MNDSWGDWLWAMALATLGIAARLGHTWAQNKTASEAGLIVRPLGVRDVVAAMIAAPVLGIIAFGFGSWLNLSGATIGAVCGFAGLLGPAALIALYDKLSDAAISIFKSKGGGQS